MSHNFITNKLKGTFIFLFFFLLSQFAIGQTKTQQDSDSTALITYQEYISRIEKKFDVRIFFKDEWLENKMIHSTIADQPLENSLASICRLVNLDYRIINNNSVVFTQKSAKQSATIKDNQSDIILIGKTNEFGKFPKALLSGIITDGATGEPLPGVIVQVEKLNLSAVTNGSGYYELNLPVGEHILRMRSIGYEDMIQKIKLASNGTGNFDIFQKTLQLQGVIITDKRADNNITRSQMGSFHLDNKSLKLMPSSLGEADILRSMTSLPGVQSPGEFGAGFIVRGGGADQNLILVEEVPLFNSSHLFGLSTAINSDCISNVTLYKAGIPARYGERTSSVMTIRLGTDEIKRLKLKGGIGLLDSRLSLETPFIKNRAYLMIGSRSSYSNWLLHQVPDIDLKNSTAGFYDINSILTLNAGPKDKFTIFGYYSNDKFSFNRNTYYQYSNLLSSIRWNHNFNKRLSSTFIAGLSKYSFGVSAMDTLNVPEASQVNFLTLYNTAKWSMSWSPNNKHTFDFGFNGIFYTNKPGDLQPYNLASLVKPKTLQTEKSAEIATYISDDFVISSKVSMEAGVRFVKYISLGPGDIYSYTADSPITVENITDTLHYNNNEKMYQTSDIEPRLSFRFSLNELSSVKFSYTRMNQFISLISNTSVISPTDIWKLSSVNFKPVSCDQYSIGYFRNFNSNAVEASVEMYYKNLKHVIEYKKGAQVFMNDHLETELLDAKAHSYGIEVYVKKNNGKLTGWISYTYAHSLHKTNGLTKSEQINQNKYFDSNYDIPNNLITSLNFQISRRWRIATTFSYNTGRPVTLPELKFQSNGNQLIYYSDRNKYRLPDYHRLDISITLDQNLKVKQMWKGSWTLSVINVYGRKNAYSVFYAQEDPRTWNYSGSYNLYKMYILGIPLPIITYNFSF